jgi:hypothetical protein
MTRRERCAFVYRVWRRSGPWGSLAKGGCAYEAQQLVLAMLTVLVVLAAAIHPELGDQRNWDDCDYGFW